MSEILSQRMEPEDGARAWSQRMEEPYEYIFNMIFNAIFANLAVP